MFGKDSIKGWARPAMWFSIALLAVATAMTVANAQSAPSVMVSQTASVTASGLTTPGKVVHDTCGNLYELEKGGNLMEIPAGGGAAIYLVHYGGQNDDGLSGGLAIDSNNNLYVDNKWNGKVEKIPSTGCVPNTSAVSDIVNAGSSLGNVYGFYWYDPGDIAVDGSGTVFVATNNCCTSNKIVAETADGTALLILDANSLPQVESLAADAAGDVFFTVKGLGNVYEVKVANYGTANPTVIASGLTAAMGVSFDSAGNMFIGDMGASTGSGSIYEIPFDPATRALVPANIFLLAADLPLGNALAATAGGNAAFYTSGASADIYEQILGAAAFGNIDVGKSGSATLDVVFNEAVQPASIGLVTSDGVFSSATGGTCAAKTSYKASDSCTVNVSFTPVVPGAASGALLLGDSAGAALGLANLSGIGSGAALTADPGAIATLGSGYSTPASVARDVAGDVFIADSGADAVWEIAAGSTTVVQLGTGLSGPKGVTVDGAGNLYVADTGNSRIVEIPVVNGALKASAQTVVVSSSTTIAGSTLNSPAGLSVDAQGNLYIADTGNNRVVYLPFKGAGWAVPSAFTLGSGWHGPLATTVSSSGIIYVADSESGKIYSIAYPAKDSGATIVATGLSKPSALATDAAGDLFVVDNGNSQVLRIPNISGSLSTTNEVNVGFGVANPYGLAIDSAGNLNISDSVNAAVYAMARTNTTQNFGKWNPTTTSDPLAFSIENSGDKPLVFNTPFAAITGDTAAFAVSSSETNACKDGATLAVGASCSLQGTFTPPVEGAFSETLSFSSNAVNAASLQATFAGTGATTVATTTTFSITSPTGTPYYGQPITITATVSAASETPIGTVALQVDGNQAATATLSNGSATFSLTNGLSGGSHTLQVSYKGGDSGFLSFSPSSSAAQTIDVTKVSTTSAVSFITLFTNPMSQPAGTAIQLVATVTPAAAGLPTGTVTFSIAGSGGSPNIQDAPLLPVSGGLFQAVYSYTPVAPAPGVTYNVISISAVYGGDGNFTASTAPAESFYVAPPKGSVLAAPSGLSITSSTASAGSVTFASTSYGGWNGIVGFSCLDSSLPANTRCVFSPGQANVFASSPGTTYQAAKVNLSITVDNPPQTPTASGFKWWLGGLAGLLLVAMRRRMRRQGWSWAVALVAAAVFTFATSAVTGCAGSTHFTTPKGSSKVTVFASSDPYLLTQTGFDSSKTQPCGVNSSQKTDPAMTPCSQQSFEVSVTIQ